MYNGIGLRTPRGTGTSGYVQKNKSFSKPKGKITNTPYDYGKDEGAKSVNIRSRRKVLPEVKKHKMRRQVELDCLLMEEELRKTLEVNGSNGAIDGTIDESDILLKVARFRSEKLMELEEYHLNNSKEALSEQKDREMDRLRDAFRIKEDFKEGDAFRFEKSEKADEQLEDAEEGQV